MNRKHILHWLQVNLQNWDNRNNMESYVEMTLYHKVGHWNDVHCEKINEWMFQLCWKISGMKFVD